MKKNDSLHSQTSGEAIWSGRYINPLSTIESEYMVARNAYQSVVKFPEEHSQAYFGIAEVYMGGELMEAKKYFVEKAMTFASTLFSAINSPFGFIPWKKETMLCKLRVVVGEIDTCSPGLLTSSHKEVLIACYMMLEKDLSGLNANKEYYSAVAKKLLDEVFKDETVSTATWMLTVARGSSMSSLSEKQRAILKSYVMQFLEQIHAYPATISRLGQGWKTYVRLARMIFAWKYMFFGLRFDKSKDLHIKSYLFFMANFYKK